jgi:ligand-binding sensor domain-containing protein
MIWTATNGGVFYYSNNKWAMLSLPSEITGAVVTALAVDKKNNILWIGTTSGAVRYSTGIKK